MPRPSSCLPARWINGVAGRVINPPLPFALGGGTFPMPTLMHLAAMAGLPTGRGAPAPGDDGETPMSTDARGASSSTAGCSGRSCRDTCRTAAAGSPRCSGAPLLQVDLHHSSERGWQFVDASGAADFRIGGRPLATALARGVRARERRRMILLAGIADESPLALVIEALDAIGAELPRVRSAARRPQRISRSRSPTRRAAARSAGRSRSTARRSRWSESRAIYPAADGRPAPARHRRTAADRAERTHCRRFHELLLAICRHRAGHAC